MRAAATCLLLLCIAAPSAAQERSDQTLPRVRLSGIVRDSAGTPVADVGLMLMPGQKSATTDANGRFEIGDIGPEHITYQLRARRIGFMPATYFVRMTGRDTTIGFRLQKRPQLLDTIVVSGRECSRNSFDGFLCRRAKGQGLYLTEADILAKNPRYLADVVSGIKGFTIEPIVGAYGPQRVVTVAPSRCVVTLVNGRPPVMGSATDPGGMAPLTLEDALTPDNLIGVEVYPPGTYAPVEYGGLATRLRQPGGVGTVRGSRLNPRRRRVPAVEERCSLINYWTPAGIRRRPAAAPAPTDSAKRDTTKPPAR